MVLLRKSLPQIHNLKTAAELGVRQIMNPPELDSEVFLRFPALWPSSPKWNWVSIHDGYSPNLCKINELIELYIKSDEVTVIVHSEFGIAKKLSKRNAVNFFVEYILKYDIQVSDQNFSCFLSISRSGVATGDA